MSTFRGRLPLAVLGALLAASPRAAAPGIDDEPSGFSDVTGADCTGAGTLDGGVSAVGLLRAAIVPTIIVFAVFFVTH